MSCGGKSACQLGHRSSPRGRDGPGMCHCCPKCPGIWGDPRPQRPRFPCSLMRAVPVCCASQLQSCPALGPRVPLHLLLSPKSPVNLKFMVTGGPTATRKPHFTRGVGSGPALWTGVRTAEVRGSRAAPPPATAAALALQGSPQAPDQASLALGCFRTLLRAKPSASAILALATGVVTVVLRGACRGLMGWHPQHHKQQI